MNNTTNTNKNPLELALEAFLNGTEELKNSKIELETMMNLIISKQELLKLSEEKSTEERDEIKLILCNNLELYSKVNDKLNMQFENKLDEFQKRFQSFSETNNTITLFLNNNDKKLLQYIENQIKQYLKFSLFTISTTFLLLIITGLSGYFATQFYKSSVMTKTEAKYEIIEQLKTENKKIVNEKHLNDLERERFIIKKWIETFPPESQNYQTFRQGIISANSKENQSNDINNNK